MESQVWNRVSDPNLSPETKFSGANEKREISIYPVQLTTSRTDSLIRLILTLNGTNIHTRTSLCGA